MRRERLAMAGAKGHDLPKPFRYPRPYEPEDKPPAATRAEIAARIPRR